MGLMFKKYFMGLLLLLFLMPIFAFERGIYITEYTAMSPKRLQSLIDQAKPLGITTFVVDVGFPNKSYEKGIQLIKQSGLHYIARLVMFPWGGTPEQIKSQEYWDKRLQQAKYAISLGAEQIQMDYIRYKPIMAPLQTNVRDVYAVIQYFKQKLAPTPIQIDVFGIVLIKPGLEIGQNIAEFANTVDAICPMVYPSHFEPYLKHAVTPYETVANALAKLKEKIIPYKDKVKIYVYIENFNYRYPMSKEKRIQYTMAQMKAVHDQGANGWYMWSANNMYDLVFQILKAHPNDPNV